MMHIIDCEMICYTKILCRKKLIDIFVAFDRFLLYITRGSKIPIFSQYRNSVFYGIETLIPELIPELRFY